MKKNFCYKLLIIFALCLVTKIGFAADDANNSFIGIRQAKSNSFLETLGSFDDWPRQKKATA